MTISFSVLRDRNAARIFSGQVISQICDKMMTLGLVWVISGMGSLKQVPWFLAAGALPHLLLSRWTGRWVGRLGPLKTIIGTDIIRGVIFLIAWGVWMSSPPVSENVLPTLIFMTLLTNSASALFNPAIMTLPMQLSLATDGFVGQLTALVDSCFSMGNILGPVAVAVLYPRLGLSGLFLLNGLSYFLAAGLEAGIRITPPGQAIEKELSGFSLTHGRVAFTEDTLLHFMLGTFFFMNLVLTPMFAFLPLFARLQFHGGIETLASLEIALGVGTVIGGFGLTIFTGEMKTGLRTILGSFIVSFMYLFFSFNHSHALACVALFVLGLSLSVVNISLLTLFQMRPEEKDVPKVMSFVNLISVGALPFSMLLVGGFLERLNMQTLAITCACGFLGLTLLTAFHREFRRI